MKWLLLGLLLSGSALAGDRTALVMVRSDLLGHKPAVRETVPARTLQQIYYLTEPCPLPLVDTRGMHLAFSQWDAAFRRPSCWFSTLDKGITVLWRDGGSSHTDIQEVNYSFVPAMVHDDGSATILEPYK